MPRRGRDIVKELKESLKKFCSFDENILYVKWDESRKVIHFSNVNLGKFSLKELEEYASSIKTEEVRKIVLGFVEFVKEKVLGERKVKVRPKYINISFPVSKEDLMTFSKWLESNKSVLSFREFVLMELAKKFDIKPSGFHFAVRSKKKEVSSPQILLPEKFFREVAQKFGWDKKTARKKISEEITKIIMDKVNVMRRWRNW